MIFNFLPYPASTSFELLGDNPKSVIRKALLDGEAIEVYVNIIGKSRVTTSIQYGESCLSLCIPMEGFKTHEETTYSYFSGESTTLHYFKKLKSQGLEEYKAYLKAALEKLEKEWNVKITQEVMNVYNCAF